jgi:CRISPR-associated protein Cas1
MSVLYLTEQRSIVRKTSDRLIVEKDDQVLLEIPCLKLDTVLIFGNVQVTTQALVEMLDHGIELAFFSLSGKLRGQLTPPKAKNMPLRMKQYELARAESFCLALARRLVGAKIGNALAVLRRYRMNHPEVISLEEIRDLQQITAGIERALSLESLLGLEGSAAARYFRSLGKMVPPEVQFDGRNRRPPRDPFNALLSFGYVLVGQELQSLLDGMGFDPYLGVYHQIDYGRPSLALDLLEEFRAALVDRFSASLLNTGVLRLEDFVKTPEGGVQLHREAMKRYFAAYSKELTTPFSVQDENLSYRQIFRRQAERLARTFIDDEEYEPFQLPC